MKSITEKQAAFLTRLATERGIDMDAATIASLTSREASAKIDTLLAMPRPPRVFPTVDPADLPQPGYYATADKFVCVVESKRTGRRSAKSLEFSTGYDGAERPSWDYQKGLVYRLVGAKPLTAEQVKEFGYAHGYCMKCLKPLTDPVSVERGAGPVCWKRLVGSSLLAA